MRYQRAALWIFWARLLRSLHLPWEEADDRATLARSTCALDFEPAEVMRVGRWVCPHMTITCAGRRPSPWCGCVMVRQVETTA